VSQFYGILHLYKMLRYSYLLPQEPVEFGSQQQQEEEGPHWLRPVSLPEALRLAAQLPDAAYRLGGTGTYKLYPPPPRPATVIDLAALPELKGKLLTINVPSISRAIGRGGP
jgi:hypothetical protein